MLTPWQKYFGKMMHHHHLVMGFGNWEYRENIPSSITAAGEKLIDKLTDKLTHEFQQFREIMSYPPPVQAVFQLTESVLLLRREDIEGGHHKVLCSFTCETTERI